MLLRKKQKVIPDKENLEEKQSEETLPIQQSNLDIGPLPTSKDKILQHPLADQGLIPKLCTSSVFCGISGMGKSNLLATLVIDPRFFNAGKDGGDFFTHRFLISPTGDMDDIQKHLNIRKEFICTNLNNGHYILRGIMKQQKAAIKKMGNHKAPIVLVIFDDCISHRDFMDTDEFIRSFIACRHFNMSSWICAQAWTGVPRKCRLQAKNIFFFAAPQSEVEHLCEEYCPPQMNKKQFYALVNYATEEPFSFLYINNTVPMEQRFRRNFDEIIELNKFRALTFSSTKSQQEVNAENSANAIGSDESNEGSLDRRSGSTTSDRAGSSGTVGISRGSNAKRSSGLRRSRPKNKTTKANDEYRNV